LFSFFTIRHHGLKKLTIVHLPINAYTYKYVCLRKVSSWVCDISGLIEKQ